MVSTFTFEEWIHKIDNLRASNEEDTKLAFVASVIYIEEANRILHLCM